MQLLTAKNNAEDTTESNDIGAITGGKTFKDLLHFFLIANIAIIVTSAIQASN